MFGTALINYRIIGVK